jgi:hypothetical protein
MVSHTGQIELPSSNVMHFRTWYYYLWSGTPPLSGAGLDVRDSSKQTVHGPGHERNLLVSFIESKTGHSHMFAKFDLYFKSL